MLYELNVYLAPLRFVRLTNGFGDDEENAENGSFHELKDRLSSGEGLSGIARSMAVRY